MDNVNEMTKAALSYLEKGMVPIPVSVDKRPLISWKEWQTKKPSPETIAEWDGLFAHGGVGLVTGSITNLIVVDIDPKNGGLESFAGLHLPPTLIVNTGGGGFHYYYKWTGSKRVPNIKGYKPGIDIQGEGAYVVAPPSLHQSGERYTFANEGEEIVEAPDWLIALAVQTPTEPMWRMGATGVSKGSRNATAASFCGKLLTEYAPAEWNTSVWRILRDWNQRCTPPLELTELRQVFESITKRESDKSETPSNARGNSAQQLLEIAKESVQDLFIDDMGQAYVAIPVDAHREVLKVRSSRFRSWLGKQHWEKTGRTANSEALKTAQDLVEAQALFGSPERRSLWTRVGRQGDTLWYDLSNQDWSAVKITSEGWEVVDTPPSLFYRHKHQHPQTKPVAGGNIEMLTEHFNIKNPQQRLLLAAYIVSCFVPHIPHPIPILYGSQGSAKSTLFRMIKKVVDPSALPLLSLPTNNPELVQKLSHHWIAYFDNVTTMPQWAQDALCRAATGEGFSKRELYSDDEDVIYTFRRAVGLNGINVAGEKPDLLDRSILFGLERIDPKQRKDEETLWREFDDKLPYILGAIFETLSKAIKIYPSVAIEELPRMADFAKWGCAIAEALGFSGAEFLSAYRANIQQQNDEVLRESTVASTVLAFMADKDEWNGTMTELYSEMTVRAETEKIDTHSKSWPKAANALSRALNVVKVNLLEAGVTFEFSRGKVKSIRIIKTAPVDDTVDVDDIPGT